MKANAVISSEAGDAILQILQTHASAAKPEELKEIGETLKKLNDKPRAVTPVIFAMPGEVPGVAGEATALRELLDPLARTTFDLAGDDLHREWPWVKPGTSLLVWDPAGTGKITSGRALFGSATWWIAFRDGYEALAVLDDNRDGQLSGEELQGIAVWTDKNGNGVSEPGEVVPAGEAGIVSIGVRAHTAADGTLMVDGGITLTSGASVPTFDWVTGPVRVASRTR
jgi:hypothetical protein